MYDFDDDSLVTLENEQGEEIDFLLLDVLPYEGTDYLFLLPFSDEDQDTEDTDVLVLRCDKDENGEKYATVEDEALLEKLLQLFMDALNSRKPEDLPDDLES